jgi:opacity protein-like surface antigen
MKKTLFALVLCLVSLSVPAFAIQSNNLTLGVSLYQKDGNGLGTIGLHNSAMDMEVGANYSRVEVKGTGAVTSPLTVAASFGLKNALTDTLSLTYGVRASYIGGQFEGSDQNTWNYAVYIGAQHELSKNVFLNARIYPFDYTTEKVNSTTVKESNAFSLGSVELGAEMRF